MLKKSSPASARGPVRLKDVVNVIEMFDDLKTRLSRVEREGLAERIVSLFENGPPVKKYRVLIPEVHVSVRYVEARDEDEAVEKAFDADEERLEFVRTLDEDEAKLGVEEVT